MPIIDAHVHVLDFPSLANLEDKIRTGRDVIEFRKKYPDLFHKGRSEAAQDNTGDLLERMDRYGITHAVVQATSGNTTNEQVAEVVGKHPDRLFGLCGLGKSQQALRYDEDPGTLRLQLIREADDCLTHLGMRGVGEFSARRITEEIQPERIAADFEPLMAVLEQRGASLQIPTAWTQYAGGLVYGDPIWVDEVAYRHPTVPIILTKMGRGIQHLFDNALMVALRNDNVFFDTVGTTPQHLRTAVAELGSDRIMFGTDWSATWRWVREPADVHAMRLATIDEAGLSQSEREDILWRTAAKVFRLDL